MSNRVPYIIMREFLNEKINEMFLEMTRNFHGWEKQDFLDALFEEIHAQHEEEMYDIAIEAPEMLQ